MASDSSEFVVKLNGIKLPPEAEADIAREIRSVVMRGLAKVDTRAELVARIPHKEWIGIWIEKLGTGKIPRLEVTQK